MHFKIFHDKFRSCKFLKHKFLICNLSILGNSQIRQYFAFLSPHWKDFLKLFVENSSIFLVIPMLNQKLLLKMSLKKYNKTVFLKHLKITFFLVFNYENDLTKLIGLIINEILLSILMNFILFKAFITWNALF